MVHIPCESVTPDRAKDTFKMPSKHVGGTGDELEEEKLRKFRWQMI